MLIKIYRFNVFSSEQTRSVLVVREILRVLFLNRKKDNNHLLLSCSITILLSLTLLF